MKKLLCRLFGHKLVMDVREPLYAIIRAQRFLRLRCTRCGARDPYRSEQVL